MQRSLLLRPSSSDADGTSPPSALAKGFRPFFLLAGLCALTFVPLWLLILRGTLRAPSYLDPISFHAHEMLFGFVLAVIAGFLLTAVGNWTKRETAVGLPLLALASLWLAGRLAMLFSDTLPRGVTAAVELAFLPALIASLARPLIAAKSRRNFAMLGILVALLAADVCIHLAGNGILAAAVARHAYLAAVDCVLLVILIIAGRVFPMFTKNATEVASIRSIPWLDRAAIGAMLLSTLLDVWSPESHATAISFGATGILAAARAVHWGARYSLRQPLLWILHAGYAWLCFGLFFRGFAAFAAPETGSLATHALTVGAIGSLTLGMMARVTLGHTGRMLVAPRSMGLAFAAINAAALFRCFGPLLAPQRYLAVLVAAGLLWIAAFALFVIVYAPMLLRPRVDGRPG